MHILKSITISVAIIGALTACEPVSQTQNQAADEIQLLDLRQQAAIEDGWLDTRLDTIVPAFMREYETDMWILIAREYNEDPVVKTMLPARWLSARRRMILVFSRDGAENGGSVERFAVSRYPVAEFFETRWDPEAQPDQWQALDRKSVV